MHNMTKTYDYASMLHLKGTFYPRLTLTQPLAL